MALEIFKIKEKFNWKRWLYLLPEKNEKSRFETKSLWAINFMFGANKLSARTKIERWKLVSWQYIIIIKHKNIHIDHRFFGFWSSEMNVSRFMYFNSPLTSSAYTTHAITNTRFLIFRFKSEWSKRKNHLHRLLFICRTECRAPQSWYENARTTNISFSPFEKHIRQLMIIWWQRTTRREKKNIICSKTRKTNESKNISHKVFRTIVEKKQDRTKEENEKKQQYSVDMKIRWCSFQFAVHKFRVELIIGCLESNYYFDTMDYDIGWIAVFKRLLHKQMTNIFEANERRNVRMP